LLKPPVRMRKQSRAAVASWEGVDRGLFDALRSFRRERAEEHGVPPYVVFSDATLRELARVRPSSADRLLAIHGIGQKKSSQYGGELLHQIAAYCRETGIALDAARPPMPVQVKSPTLARSSGASASATKHLAMSLFADGKSIDEVIASTGRAASTVTQYLVDFIEQEAISDCDPWLTAGEFEQVRKAVAKVGSERLRPIFDELGGRVDYEKIHISLACMRNLGDAIVIADN
jgi:ATP-dependent DNA helicase RecQ